MCRVPTLFISSPFGKIPKSFEDALARVKLLAERFRQNEAVYLSPKYQEAEVRQDFLVYQLYDITPDERKIIEGI